MQGLLPAWVGEEWGLSGLAVLTSLSSTGKNLYTNEYVAIKLVSPGSSHNSRNYPHVGSGQEEGQCYTPGNPPPPPHPSRSPSSRGHRSCTWNTASTSSSAPQVPPRRGSAGRARGQWGPAAGPLGICACSARRGCPSGLLLWPVREVQRHGAGAARAQPGGPIRSV